MIDIVRVYVKNCLAVDQTMQGFVDATATGAFSLSSALHTGWFIGRVSQCSTLQMHLRAASLSSAGCYQ